MIEFIVPAVDDRLALCDVADRFLPAIARGEAAAFHDAASGEADESRVHVVEQLHEIFAQAVGTVLPRVDRNSETMSRSTEPASSR